MNPSDERVMPWSMDAEQAVLGGLMLANEGLALVADWLRAEDFFREDHRAIFDAILKLAACDPPKPFDAVTVGEQMPDAEAAAYVIELVGATASAANVTAYAEIVKSKATQRKLIEIGQGVAGSGFNPEGRDLSEIVSDATAALSELQSIRRGGVKSASQIGKAWLAELSRRYDCKGQLQGLPTPWSSFNRMTGGLTNGELIIVAGRPSMGKSAWAVNLLTSVAMRGKRALMFNLEMTDVSIFNRAVASIGNIPLAWLKAPNGSDGDYWASVTPAVAKIKDSGLLIDDTAGLTVQQIIARARREQMRGPLSLVVVDHLHLMPLPGKTRETVEIGHITAALKKLAKELDCPVVLLSQLNRGVESRMDKRPMMADLRESGNIEQDADLIMFLYRDDYYAERLGKKSEHPGMVEMIVAKQREGETGKAWGRSALAFGRIDDCEYQPNTVDIEMRSTFKAVDGGLD